MCWKDGKEEKKKVADKCSEQVDLAIDQDIQSQGCQRTASPVLGFRRASVWVDSGMVAHSNVDRHISCLALRGKETDSWRGRPRPVSLDVRRFVENLIVPPTNYNQ